MVDDQGLIHSIERIDALVQRIEAHADSGVQNEVRELVQCLLDYHGAAVGRMVQLLGQPSAADGPIMHRLAEDELVASLLLLHGCHPHDFQELALYMRWLKSGRCWPRTAAMSSCRVLATRESCACAFWAIATAAPPRPPR